MADLGGSAYNRSCSGRGSRSDGVPADLHPRLDVDTGVEPIRAARAAARARVWTRRRPVAGVVGSQVTFDLDAKVVTAHSENELAAPTFKRGFGFHQLFAFCDGGHGPGRP